MDQKDRCADPGPAAGKGLTQQGLAELLGVSNRAVSKWERGLGSPDLSPAARPVPPAGRGSGRTALRRSPGTRQHRRKHETHSIFCLPPSAAISSPPPGRPPSPAAGGGWSPCPSRSRTRPTASRSIRWRTSGSSPPATPWRKGTACPFGSGHRRAGHRDEVLARVGPPAAHPRRGHGMLYWHCTQHGLFRQVL